MRLGNDSGERLTSQRTRNNRETEYGKLRVSFRRVYSHLARHLRLRLPPQPAPEGSRRRSEHSEAEHSRETIADAVTPGRLAPTNARPYKLKTLDYPQLGWPM